MLTITIINGGYQPLLTILIVDTHQSLVHHWGPRQAAASAEWLPTPEAKKTTARRFEMDVKEGANVRIIHVLCIYIIYYI